MSIRFIQDEKVTSDYTVWVSMSFAGLLTKDEAGYYVWVPPNNLAGYIPEWVITALSKKLKALNKKWHKEVTSSTSINI